MDKTIKIAIFVAVGAFSIFAIWQTILAIQIIEVGKETEAIIRQQEGVIEKAEQLCQDK